MSGTKNRNTALATLIVRARWNTVVVLQYFVRLLSIAHENLAQRAPLDRMSLPRTIPFDSCTELKKKGERKDESGVALQYHVVSL
jgi:hypothetical protein